MSQSRDEDDRADRSEHRADKSEIRMDHFEQKAAADKFVTEQQAIALAGHIDDLVEGVKNLAGGVAALRRAEHKRNKLLVMASILVFGFGVAFLVNFQRSFTNQATLKEQGRIIEAVTGCTTEDSIESCQDKQENRSVDEGLARLKAVECIGRSLKEGDPKHVVEQKCFPPPKSKPAPPLPPPPDK